MLTIPDTQFEQMIADAMDELPPHYAENMNNVAITWDYDPTPEQRHKMKLQVHQTLFGLYEGIPLTQRGAAYNLALPDKITIFKHPILFASRTVEGVKKQVKHTLWHELAHHFGLDHEQIYAAEDRRRERDTKERGRAIADGASI